MTAVAVFAVAAESSISSVAFFQIVCLKRFCDNYEYEYLEFLKRGKIMFTILNR